MSVKICGEIGERSARVFDNKTGNARMLFLAFRNYDRCAFFDSCADEFVAIGFLASQCHEQAIPLHSPRVIRDAFHRAINCPDDLASWKRGGESFELHEVSTCPPGDRFAAANRGKAFNGVEHWLGRLVPLVRPCELAPPAWVFRPVLRESLCEFAHVRIIEHHKTDKLGMLGRQIADERNDVLSVFISAFRINFLRGSGLAGNRKTWNSSGSRSAAIAYDTSERISNFSGGFRRNHLTQYYRGK